MRHRGVPEPNDKFVVCEVSCEDDDDDDFLEAPEESFEVRVLDFKLLR